MSGNIDPDLAGIEPAEQFADLPTANIPHSYPPGTRVSTCLECGEQRYITPTMVIDPWKKHTDHCPEEAD